MRFRDVVTFGGNQPNVVPPEARVVLLPRPVLGPARRAREQGAVVAKAAAEMNFTTVDKRILSGSWPFNGNKSFSDVLNRNIELVGMPQWSAEDKAFAEVVQRSTAPATA